MGILFALFEFTIILSDLMGEYNEKYGTLAYRTVRFHMLMFTYLVAKQALVVNRNRTVSYVMPIDFDAYFSLNQCL